MTWRIHTGDALGQLRLLPAESVHCCVTSPPYWGLRDYGTGDWVGGDPDCDHLAPMPGGTARSSLAEFDNGLSDEAIAAKVQASRQQYRDRCRRCGAERVDLQLGLEETPEQFVAAMVAIFAEVWRVLRPDGTLWLNLGDSYARSAGSRRGNFGRCAKGIGIPDHRDTRKTASGLKDKDLAGVPWLVALALRAKGWYLRRDIIWSKPNPMPESVTDRPTTAHEYLFLLTKGPRYFYDAEAIREPDVGSDHPRSVLHTPEPSGGLMPEHSGLRTAAGRQGLGRNKRSVWTIATRPFPEAHFATFPPELVEPCILAGTPPMVCGECSAPWRRVLEVEPNPGGISGQAGIAYSKGTPETTIGCGEKISGRHVYRRAVDRGWEPTCDHEDDSGRAVVLDPFSGAATTILVATQLGRHAIGLELNPEYVALGEQRIQRWEANPAGRLGSPAAIHDAQIGLEVA